MDKDILFGMGIDANTFFAALAHPLRLRALVLLCREKEMCVCELTHALAVSQPMISRHLAQLRQWGLVSDRRQGLWIYYRLHPELPAWAASVVAATEAALHDQPPFAVDRQLLQVMPNRPGPRCCA